jgi:predicted acetyltransferase
MVCLTGRLRAVFLQPQQPTQRTSRMSLEICLHQDEHKPVIWNLFQFYCYDTSPEDGDDVEDTGLYALSCEYFAQYWSTPNWRAHLLRWNGAIAGFALIEDSDAVPGAMELADLFVMQRFRRHGIARQVVHHFLSRRDIPWTVVVFNEAGHAKAFWKAMFQIPGLTPARQLADPDARDAVVHVLEPTIAAS